MPKISIIVPIYKANIYLNACIDSILAQSFNEYELILVNDGSPDNCGNICDEYAKHDKRIRVIHQTNQGQAAARNRALSIARGEWICFVDSDDIIHPQMLEILYYAATNTNTNISMCSALEAEVCPDNFFIPHKTIFTTMEINEIELLQLYKYVRYKPWVVWGKLIRKQIVESIPFTENKIYEDNAVVCQWLISANKIVDINAPLYFYRSNTEGTTKCSFQLKHLDYLWALEQMILFFENHNYQSLTKYFTKLYLITTSQYYYKVLNELHQKPIAHSISKKMRTIYYPRKSMITLSNHEKKSLYTVMYPYTKFIWKFISALSYTKKFFLYHFYKTY